MNMAYQLFEKILNSFCQFEHKNSARKTEKVLLRTHKKIMEIENEFKIVSRTV